MKTMSTSLGLGFSSMSKWNPQLCLILVLFMLVGCAHKSSFDQQTVKSAVRAVLEQQVKDWNAGSIEQFMRGYANAATTRFASGGEVHLGWQTVFDRYQTTYGNQAAMGTLTFSDLDITVAAADAALVFGRWQLEREKDKPTGLFTLFFRKTNEGWRIVHDHTSATSKN